VLISGLLVSLTSRGDQRQFAAWSRLLWPPNQNG